MPDEQITLSLVLQAQNQASAAIAQVGKELAAVGRDVSLSDFSASMRRSIDEVNKQLRQASTEKINLARQTAADEIHAAQTQYTEILRAAKEHFAQVTQAAKDADAKALEGHREALKLEASAARGVLAEKLRDLDAEQDAELATIKKTTAEKIALLEKVRSAAVAGGTLGGGTLLAGRVPAGGKWQVSAAVAPDTAALVEAARKEQEAQNQALKDGMTARRALLRGEAQQEIKDARARIQGLVEAEKVGAAEQRRELVSKSQAAQSFLRQHYDERVDIARHGLAQESIVISSALQKDLRLQRSYADAALTESKRLAQEQERLAKEAAAQQERIAKAGGMLGYGLEQGGGALSRFGGAVSHLREKVTSALGPLHGMVETGKQMIVWGLGYQMMFAVTGALGSLVTGLITTNDSFEQVTKTFVAFYGDAAPRVVDWLDKFAAKTPATREEVRTAGLTIAALGDNIGQVMPPLEDLATVMGVDLPKAAQAFSDAQEGRFYMLKRDLHVSKEELVKYGLDLDNVGKTFVGAFIAYVQDRFGGATQRTIGTFAQVLSNVGDNFHNLQRIAGHGIFSALKTELNTLSKALENPLLLSWAHRTGRELGTMVQQAIKWFDQLWHRIGQGPGALAMLGHAVQTAMSIWNGLADIFQFAKGTLEFLLGMLQRAIGIFDSLTGAGKHSTDMLRTMIGRIGEAIIVWKLLTGGLGLAKGALVVWNSTVGLANKAFIALTTATEAQTAKNALLAKSEAGVALATEGATGAQVIATGKAGLLGTAIGGLTKGYGLFKGALLATLGPIGIWIAALALAGKAIMDLGSAYDILVNKMDPAAKKDLTAALSPTGTGGGEPVYGMRRIPHPRSPGVFTTERVQVGVTPAGGHMAEFAGYLGTVDKTGEAYFAYTRMIDNKNPDYWIKYLRDHPTVAKEYLKVMDREGRGKEARAIIAGTSPLLTKYTDDAMISPTAGGGSMADMLGKEYAKAKEQFSYDVERGPKGKQNTERLQSALADLENARAIYVQLLEEQGKTVKEANNIAGRWFDQQKQLIPKQFLTGGGAYVPGEPTEKGSVGGGTEKEPVDPKKALRAFIAQHWSPTLARIRAGTINQTDVSDMVQQYEELERAAGIPIDDTKIQNQIKAATKSFVSTLGHNFSNTMSRLKRHVHGATIAAAQAVIAHIQQVERDAGLPDTTGGMQLAVYRYQHPGADKSPAGRALSDDRARLAIDLRTRGDSAKDWSVLTADAARLRRDDLAAHHSKTHADAVYTTAMHQAAHHMSIIAGSRLKDDLASLGTSAKDHKRLLDDVNKLYADEKREFPHSQRAHADYMHNLKLVSQHLHDTTKGKTGVDIPTPMYGPYRITTPQYGATQVSFGGDQKSSMAALIGHLQSLVTYWMARARKDEAALHAQEQTASNTKLTAEYVNRLAQITPWKHPSSAPAPTRNADSDVRARSGFTSMRRV